MSDNLPPQVADPPIQQPGVRRRIWRWLAVVLVVAAPLLYFFAWLPFQQRQFISEVRQMGGTVAILFKSTRWSWQNQSLIDLSGVEGCDDDFLKRLASRTNPFLLNLSRTSVTDAGLEHLTSCRSLGSLDLSQTSITDNGLKHIASFEWLQDLSLRETKITDVGLQHLQNLTLINVDLSRTQITDAGLAPVEGCRALWLDETNGIGKVPAGPYVLSLAETQITGASFKQNYSRILNLEGTTIGDDVVPSLKNCVWLNLNATQITDDGLGLFASPTDLMSISLEDTAVTEAGMAEFQRRLPNCRIGSNPNSTLLTPKKLAAAQMCDAFVRRELVGKPASEFQHLLELAAETRQIGTSIWYDFPLAKGIYEGEPILSVAVDAGYIWRARVDKPEW